MTDKEIKHKLTYLTGEMRLKPVEYRLTKTIKHRWYWFDKVEYYIETDFMKLGPYTKDEAYMMASYGGLRLIDKTGE